MNWTLFIFVMAYLVGTLMIGVLAGRRIKTTSDFALAGRNTEKEPVRMEKAVALENLAN